MDVYMKGFITSLTSKVKIADVLNERSITPNKQYGDKLIYKCPIHKGDNSPSFYVYQKDYGDDFFCYGCKSGGNVIKLVQLLNNCSSKDAIKIVSDKAGVSCDPYIYDMDFDIGDIKDYDSHEDMDSLMFSITLLYRKSCHMGMSEMVNNIDKFWPEVDRAYWNMNVARLKEIVKWINGR